jgi:hypothetical protein
MFEAERGRNLGDQSRAEEVADHAESAARQAAPGVERLARLGYVAKGVVYAVIGFLALREALGAGGKTTDPSGAIHSIGTQPFGGIMLTLLAVGLVYYAMWKVVQGVIDPDGKGSDAHGILRRVAYAGSGAMGKAEERWVVYAGRIGTAARAIAIGVAGVFLLLAAYHSDPDEVRGLGAALEIVQHQPFGPYMLGTIAFGLLVYGAFVFAIARYRRIDPA